MIVVNYASKHYKRGQDRLFESIRDKNVSAFFRDELIEGCPTHQQSPYEFKVHFIKAASETDNIVLWMDASMWVVGDLSIIERHIQADGYFMTECGHYTGRWTNQFAKEYFAMTPEESREGPGGMTMFSAGLLGLDMNTDIAKEFMRQWEASARAGCFTGNYIDHRHDQSCASIIAQRLGMKYHRGGQYMSYIGPGYSAPEAGSIVYLQGVL